MLLMKISGLWQSAREVGRALAGARNLEGKGLADFSTQRPCFRAQLHALRLYINLHRTRTGGVRFLPRRAPPLLTWCDSRRTHTGAGHRPGGRNQWG